MIARSLFMALSFLLVSGFSIAAIPIAKAQTPPSADDINAYDGVHRAAQEGDLAGVRKLIADGVDLEARDPKGRTALHVAAFASHDDVIQALAEAGADLNALERRAYDIVTIAAVANDLDLLDLSLSLGASAGNVTSPYDGTALIAGYARIWVTGD